MTSFSISRSKIALLFTLAIFLFSCSANRVAVKIKNDSGEDFTNVLVNIMGKQYILNEIKSGSYAKTIKVKQTYSLFATTVMTDRDTIKFIPLDFTGQTPMTTGTLSVKLNLVTTAAATRRLNIQSEKQP